MDVRDSRGVKPDRKELATRFMYHEAQTPVQAKIHQRIDMLTLELAKELVDHVPEGRYLSLALTKLEEVRFWANSGVARELSRE